MPEAIGQAMSHRLLPKWVCWYNCLPTSECHEIHKWWLSKEENMTIVLSFMFGGGQGAVFPSSLVATDQSLFLFSYALLLCFQDYVLNTTLDKYLRSCMLLWTKLLQFHHYLFCYFQQSIVKSNGEARSTLSTISTMSLDFLHSGQSIQTTMVVFLMKEI